MSVSPCVHPFMSHVATGRVAQVRAKGTRPVSANVRALERRPGGRRQAQSVGSRPLPPLPAALGPSRSQPRAPSQPERAREGAAGCGEGRRRGEGGRQGSREGGREERRTQRAPGSWSFCSAWPGFNAQQQRAAAAASSPGAPAAAEPAAAPLPAPCKLCEQPARGAGGALGRPRSARGRALCRRSVSRHCRHRRSPAPPRGAVGGSRGPPVPAPRHCPANPPAEAGAAAARPAAGCRGAAAAAQGGAQRLREGSPAGPQRTRRARAAARPGEHGRRGVTPPCPLGIKDIQPAGVGTKGDSPVSPPQPPRATTAAAQAPGLGGGKGCLKTIHIFRPFCWTFRPPWTLKEELSSLADSDFALRFPRLLPGSPRLGGVFAFGLGLEEQPHARTRTRSEEGERQRHRLHLQCQCGAPAEGGKATLPGKEPAGGRQDSAEMPGWVPESSAAPEPVPCTHAHTQIHAGTHRAQAPAHLAPGPPRRCRAARAGISRVCSLTLPDPHFSYPGLAGRNSVYDCLSLPPGREIFFSSQPLASLAGFKNG